LGIILRKLKGNQVRDRVALGGKISGLKLPKVIKTDQARPTGEKTKSKKGGGEEFTSRVKQSKYRHIQRKKRGQGEEGKKKEPWGGLKKNEVSVGEKACGMVGITYE